MLANWCEDLKDCGVDLREYGLKETEMHEEGLTCWDFKPLDFEPFEQRKFHLRSFTYGASPNDWSVDVAEQENSLTGEGRLHIWGLDRRDYILISDHFIQSFIAFWNYC